MFGRPDRRHLPTAARRAQWEEWVADNMQQRERSLSPFQDSAPSAWILVPLLGLPVLLIVGFVVALVLK